MKLRRLEVRSFGAVGHAELHLGEGLNVLYGPNDIGKSTLVHATRLALLLPSTFAEASQHVPWGADAVPSVCLDFVADDGAHYRVSKSFDRSVRGGSELEHSVDGNTWTLIAKAREVDGRLRKILGWGIPEPGGKGGSKGLPTSFLSRALLGEQAELDAILAQSLETDRDESGRVRLVEALGAFAQDPLFKAVLDEATTRVDQAFTSRGKWRTRKDSPLTVAREAAQFATKQAEAARRVWQDAQAAQGEVHALQEALTHATERRATAQKALDAAERDLVHERAWRAAREQAVEAEKALTLGRDAWAALKVATETMAATRAAVQSLEATLAAEEANLASIDSAARAAMAALRSDADASQGRAQLLELESQVQAATLTLRLCEADARVDAARKALTQAAEADERAQASLEQAGIAHNRVVRAQARHRVQQATDALERLEARRAEADALRQTAQQRRDESRGTPWAPDAAVLHELEALQHAVDLAEARLAVGLRVRIESMPLGRVEVSQGSRAGDIATAERELTLEVSLANGEPVATLHVEGGSQDSRREAEEARTRLRQRLSPLLEKAGCEDLEGLRDAARAHARSEERLAEAERLEARAAASTPDPSDVVEAQERHDLAQREAKEAEQHLRLADEPDGDGAARDARGDTPREREDIARDTEMYLAEATKSAAQTREAKQAASSLLDACTAERQRIGAESPECSEAEARKALEEAKRSLADVQDANAAKATELNAALKKAESERLSLANKIDTIKRSLDEARENAGRAQGSHAAAAVAAESHSLDELESAHLAAQSAFEALPAPLEVDIDACRLALSTAHAAVSDAHLALERHQGRLESSGGSVARDAHERAEEALLDAEAEETRIRTDLQGWKLLQTALREAEDADAKHLGDALGVSVQGRFDDLMTAHGDPERYGALVLDPQLAAGGLNSQGAARDLHALSVGTREQLALLVRLTVAEALKAPLVLDDLLTHTDDARAGWFRQTLRRAARTTQIIVVTCRPADYLDDEDRPASDAPPFLDRAAGLVRAIDASRIVKSRSA